MKTLSVRALALVLLAGTALEAGAITRCAGPQPGAGVQCPRICVEYEKDVMRVGESQTVAIVGGLQPYRRYNDSGWQTFEMRPLTHNQFTVIATHRTTGAGGMGWAQFMFEDARRCASGRVEFRVEEGRASAQNPPGEIPGNALQPPLSSLPIQPYPPSQPPQGGPAMPSISGPPASLPPFQGVTDLNGLWKVSTQDANAAFVIVYQEGGEVRMMCAFEFQGRMVAWHSQGSLSGNQVKTRFHLTSNTKPPGWENDGFHDLTLSPDGQTLSGTGRSQSGFSYAIRFQRVK